MSFLTFVLLLSTLAGSYGQSAISANVSPQPGSTVLQLTFISVIFNEGVGGVDASDLLVNGTAVASVTTNNPNDYTFSFPQPPTGAVQVAWAAGHSITNGAGTAFAGGSWSYTLDPSSAPKPNVVISEFLADNGHGVQDEDGTLSDWIEVLNRGPLEANLSGWFLSDDRLDLTKWQFPAGMPPLPVNGYLRIWASTKDRKNPLLPLHTNFRLAREAGNFLGLMDAQTNIVSAFDPYPLQQEDVSYGRDRVDPNFVGFFSTPTPGAPNSTTGTGIAAEPVFSHATGIYTNASLSLTITSPSSGTIRYTRDGTIPGSNSTLYTVPIVLSNNATVKARIFQSGVFPSRVVGRNFIFLDNTTADFNSNIPLVIISTEGRGIPEGVPPGQPRTKGSMVVIDTYRGRSSIRGTPDYHGLAEFEIVGQTSVGFSKKPYRMELQDEIFNDLKVSLLGMPADGDWRSRNPFDDKTLLNDFLGFELFDKMGHYSVRRRLVEMFVDTGGGRLNYPGDYVGVEVLTETIKQGNDRVDIPELTPYVTNEPAITGGYIFKKDKASGGDLDFSTQGSTNNTGFASQGLKLHEPKPNSLRTVPLGSILTPSGSNQLNYLIRYLNQMESAMYSTNWLRLTGTNHYSNFLDVDSFVDLHWLIEFTKQIDGYRLSSYFTKDRNGKVQAGPVWDWNLAYGNADYLQGGYTNGWYFNDLGDGDHIWLRRLINGAPSGVSATGGDPDFNQKIADRWSVLRTNVCGLSNTLARIDELSTLLSEAAARDLWSKWRTEVIGVGLWPNPGGTVNHDGTVPARPWDVDFFHPTNYLGNNANSIIWQMKKWMTGRYTWIDSQFVPLPTFNATDGMVTNGFRVTITGPAASTVYYTLDGTDPRGSGGTTNGTVYLGPITVNGNVRIVARAKRPTSPFYNTWGGPATVTLYTGTPALRITEIMYHPAPPPLGSTNSAEDFEYIEVKNIGATPLNVNRFSLSGGINFQFPNAVLQPGESAVVVKNVAAFQSRYGTSPGILGVFTGNLDNAGDHLVLRGGAQEPILDFSYDDDWYPATDGGGFSLVIQNENATRDSWGLAGSWTVSAALNGSPGQNEGVAPSRPGLVINEALTHTDAPALDTIEIYNPTAGAVNIDGWFLSDDLQNPKKFVIPSRTVAANGFVTFSEADFNAGGSNSFALNSEGDQIWLFSGDGVNLTGYAHGYRFGAAANGVTFGHFITSIGEDHFVPQAAATLGGPNSAPLVGPIILSEIHYHPQDVSVGGIGWNNTEDEFIELHNTSDNPVSLYDTSYPTNTWRLRDAVDFEFPTGVSLPGHGSLLVVSFDPSNAAALAAFRAHNVVPGNVPVFGPFRGQLDNAGDDIELLRPDAPEPPVSNNPGFVPYILVEEIKYLPTAPWPSGADGIGLSLQRRNLSGYANDPINWTAGGSSAGAPYTGGAPPAITSQPTNTSVIGLYGQTTFSVTATGTDPLRYQWRFAGLNITDATNSSLLLSDVQASQAGEYHALVYNQAGYVFSSNATLTVIAPVSFLAQPTNQVLRGSNDVANYGKTFANATFSVNATSGSPPLSYQWYYNGGSISGATSPSLTVSNVTLAEEGVYQVLVSDSVSTAPSTPVRLSVLVTPVITDQPRGKIVAAGESTAFNVSARGHPLPFGYRWRRSGATLTNYVIMQTNGSYTLNSTRTNDAGIWTVIITNSAHLSPGILSSNAFLTVVVPPTNQTASAGSDVTLRVAAFGSGAIGYQWAFNGASIANATNSTLLVTNVQAANDGIYSVTVTAASNPGTPTILPATYSASLTLDGVPRFASPELLSGGGFTALIRGGILNQSYIVEVSTNLTNWAVLNTVNYTNNPTPFTDSGATGSRQRFYRARQSP